MFVAILVAAVSLLAVTQCGPGTLPIALPAATMTFGVVVSGFVATQRNMLLTMSGAEVLRFAVERGYHNDVISYLMDCIRAGLLIIAISLSGFFFGDNSLLWGNLAHHDGRGCLTCHLFDSAKRNVSLKNGSAFPRRDQ